MSGNVYGRRLSFWPSPTTSDGGKLPFGTASNAPSWCRNMNSAQSADPAEALNRCKVSGVVHPSLQSASKPAQFSSRVRWEPVNEVLCDKSRIAELVWH